MKPRALKIMTLAFAVLSGPAAAQVVTVKSGEHGDFTRIVLSLPVSGDWRLGRTPDGYEVAITQGRPNYDLSDVYRLIKPDRLRSIWADPGTGLLQLGIGCSCHVIPFEFGPSNLVIDIREGSPPVGSSFEVPLAGGGALAALGAVQPPRPKLRPDADEPVFPSPTYDWIAASRPPEPKPMPLPLPLASMAQEATNQTLDAEVDMKAFRNLLTTQIGFGATQGVVEMRLATPPEPKADTPPDAEQARVAISALPGLSIERRQTSEGIMANGQDCPAEDTLNIQDWATADDPASEMAAAKGSLLAEFDAPQSDQISAAARVHLAFGFGAEARNVLLNVANTFQPDPFLLAMSYLVDGDNSPENPFANMQSCNSNAALWALIAAGEGQPLDGLNGVAVARSAMELPKSLRPVLAPMIVTRLIQEGDPTNAEVVQNALMRVLPDGDPTVKLLEAEIALTEEEPAAAEARLDQIAEGEVTLDALFARVEARFQQGLTLDAGDILAIEAFAFEQRTAEREAEFQSALAHAYALSGAFEQAFAQASDSFGLQSDVWSTLARSGTDSDVLAFAVSLPAQGRDGLPQAVKDLLAGRLVELGLPNVAVGFLHDGSPVDLVAKVNLANGDARSALRALSSELDQTAPDLLAAAYETLGQYETSAEILRDSGQAEDAARLDRWQGKWPTEEETADTPWAELARLAEDSSAEPALPPLRAAEADAERSARTRDGIQALLQSVPRLE